MEILARETRGGPRAYITGIRRCFLRSTWIGPHGLKFKTPLAKENYSGIFSGLGNPAKQNASRIETLIIEKHMSMINTNIIEPVNVSDFIENPAIRQLTPLSQLKPTSGITFGRENCLFPVY